jgi:hypothetical protein
MTWKLHDDHATCEFPSSRIDVSLGSPVRLSIATASHPEPGHHGGWQVEIAPHEAGVKSPATAHALSEAFIREHDLIATYQQAAPWPFGFQVDLRRHATPIPGLHCLELWLSVQTSLLECHPQLWIRLHSGAHRWACGPRITSQDRRSGLLLHPLDQPDGRVVQGPNHSLERFELFGRFMEKGVIRRARGLLLWSEQPISDAQWDRVADEFESSPLPLTA